MDWLPEQFFHYLWKLQLFDTPLLHTTDGTAVRVAAPGQLNPHSGADFSDARIYIGDTLWAGTVEIHRHSSDWWRHQHADNQAYDNVILHVVYRHDSTKTVCRSNGTAIPTLELQDHIPHTIARRYWTLLQPPQYIACEAQLATVGDLVRHAWLDRLVVERLEQKVIQVQSALQACENDWEQTFYEALARSLGTNVNAQPMEQVARALPQTLLAKHKDNLFQLEALLLGQAGLLDESDWQEEQPARWQREFKYLQHKYQLRPLSASVWKTAKLRPANFPAVRLAQLARLAHQSSHLFSKILAISHYKEIYTLLQVELSGYWLQHFVLDELSPRQMQKTLGKATIESITINAIVPFLFAYGKAKADEGFKQKAFTLLESLPAESNALLDGWAGAGWGATNAYQSQALLQLKNAYCKEHRCLECAIGHAILHRKN